MGGKTKEAKTVVTSKAAENKTACTLSNPKLTKKQKDFCKYLASGLNATQAALKAGYSKKTARFIASENLTKPYIAAETTRSAQEAQEKYEYTKATHFLELKEAEDFAKQTGNVSAFLNAIVQKGKLFGLYIDKVETTIKEPRKFEFVIKK